MSPNTELSLFMQFLQTGAMRLSIEKPAEQRLKASQYILDSYENLSKLNANKLNISQTKQKYEILHESKLNNELGLCKYVFHLNPFWIECFYNDQRAIAINQGQLFNYEAYRKFDENLKNIKDAAEFNSLLALFEQRSMNRPNESKNGPSSVGLDFTFFNLPDCYGLPERLVAGPLEETRQTPYRIYNVDHFDERHTGQSLYGNIPMVIANNPSQSHNAGILWLNASDTYVDYKKYREKDSQLHFVSECGNLEFMTFMGQNPLSITSNYSRVTGKTPMPQKFTFGYHHCRWDSDSQKDILNISSKFDEHKIPCDCLWLDIDHTQDKKYFTWDNKMFPSPRDMLDELHSKGRNVVLISDPHIKTDPTYHIFNEAIKNKLVILNQTGQPYVAKCWPEDSVWLDYLNPKTREYWSSLYSLSNYPGTTQKTYVWNDMNEPAVFDSFENTCSKNLLHFDGSKYYEHREMHNIYSLLEVSATYKGLFERDQNKRPFLLTRSFFAGSHRYAAMWTGDARTSWQHMKLNISMLQNLAACGYSFCGADIPGFFGDADEELCIRGYQTGIFYPFMRGHAEKATKRREPWLFSKETCQKITDAIKMRYKLLPYIYTTFFENTYTKGWPLIMPLWQIFRKDSNKLADFSQFMFGQSFLVKPICDQNVNSYFLIIK